MSEMVNIYDAKSQFSKLIVRVEAGEEIMLSRNGKAVARLVPLEPERAPRRPGVWKGRVVVGDDFDDFSEADDRDWYSR